jgi:putative pyruvate formate lyase activating enzyme
MGGKRLESPTLDRAARHYSHCLLCEHRCGANRLAGERGPCKADSTPRLFRHRIEYSEEIDLVPSHLFYLSGCDLRCVFCIAELNAFDPTRGRELTSDLFNDAVSWGIARHARNIQWVGGEPTLHLPAILELMSRCPNLPTVVWKSDFHFTPEALDLLSGVADVFIADYKWGNAECASKLGGGDDYLPILQRNLLAARSVGRLIVRHLLLPGHVNCCLVPIARWMKAHLPDTEFSLRLGYLPSWRSRQFGSLSGPVAPAEAETARRVAMETGLRVIQ